MKVSNIDLSEREREILSLVARGSSNKEIALQLAISTNTVKVHLKNIFGKIGVRSRTEAAMYAVATGLVQGGVSKNEQPDEISAVSERENTIASSELGSDLALSQNSQQTVWWLFAIIILIVIGGFIGYRIRVSHNENLSASSLAASDENLLRWKTLTPMPTARLGLAVVAFEGSIYAIAGQDIDGPVGNVERYDPEQDTWISLTPKPIPVYEVQAAAIGGKIYIPGGRVSANQVIDTLEIYIPPLDRWERGASLPEALSAYALTTYEGHLYLFGGWNNKGFSDKVYVYEPGADLWVERTPLPSPRGYAGAAVTAAGQIFVVGGYDGRQALQDNLEYSPNLDTNQGNPWRDFAALPIGRYGMGVSGIADIIQVVGGKQAGNEPLLSLSYLSQSDEWYQIGKLASDTPVFPGSAILGNHFYLIGGQIEGKPTNQNMTYQSIYTLSLPIIR